MLLACDTLHMHETGGVGTGDILCARSHVAHNLVLTHADRDGGLFHGKHAAEAAALILTLRLVDGDAVLEFQQVDNLVVRLDVAL